MGTLGVQPPPVSLVWPKHTMEVLCIRQSGCSTLDLCWHLSDAATALCQPSASGSGMMVKWVGREIHSENASSIMLQFSAVLLVKEEQLCHTRAIYLHMFQILQGGITLQNVHGHSHVPGEHRRVWMPGAVSHCYFQHQGILLCWGLNYNYLRFQGHQGIRQPLD